MMHGQKVCVAHLSLTPLKNQSLALAMGFDWTAVVIQGLLELIGMHSQAKMIIYFVLQRPVSCP